MFTRGVCSRSIMCIIFIIPKIIKNWIAGVNKLNKNKGQVFDL